MNTTTKPDVERILGRLKDFQRRTVDYVIKRFYEDPDRVDRFLVADEVGLGKTMVARGVIARAIERLWDRVDRIDIVYICANAEIAHQNLNRLNIEGDRKIAFSTRLTLLPMQIRDLKGNKLNFVSFTPATSFDLRSHEGMAHERALIYHMLRRGWGFGNISGPKNLLQCYIQRRDYWLARLDQFPLDQIDPGLQDAFIKTLAKRPEIRARFDELAEMFGYARKHVPGRDREEQLKLVGELRRALAETCVRELEPDLIIMDEFQRFKDLLDGKDEVAGLARTLFNYPAAKVLLLSATPYKMYTIYHETEDNDHYADFLRTVGFLMNSQEKTKVFAEQLAGYRRELYNLEPGNLERLHAAKEGIETALRRIMVRTERLPATAARDGMVVESREDLGSLTGRELRSYAALDAVAQALGVSEPIEYWKSSPYVLSIMDRQGYKLKEKLVKALTVSQGAEEAATSCDATVLDGCQDAMLPWEMVETYSRIDPGNAKLRTLMGQKVDTGAWRLLWLPPSMPYYETPGSPYGDPALRGFTKGLVFSSWKVVPKAIAMLCSYEAERRMVTSLEGSADYQEIRRRRAPLLRFPVVDGKPGGMSALALSYPCLTLAEALDPLAISLGEGTLPQAGKVLEVAAERLQELIAPILAQYAHDDGNPLPDLSWYWAALALLDRHYHPAEVGSWLECRAEGLVWEAMVRNPREAEGDTGFAEHVGEFRKLFNNPVPLGRPPEDLVPVLAKIAMAAPGVTTLRSLLRHYQATETNAVLASAARAGLGFRTLFNQPDSITLIRGLNEAGEDRYWEAVLDYCIGGNLQAVMDEYLHILREALGLMDKTAAKALQELADEIETVVSIRTVNLDFDELQLGAPPALVRHSLRCRYALRYGDDKSEEDGFETRADQVRKAFNSPFRPFILASTSIGQEGLDFHQYCHEIYHWNLPSNPVDLEQREGRIHRYKGHAIRKNVAEKYGLKSLYGKAKAHDDPWGGLFELAAAERASGCCDLVPYWIYERDGGCKIVRHVPALPLSRELGQMDSLRRTLAAYRMVFGQPRQEDLVSYIHRRVESDVDVEALLALRINLAP
ncbi:MAG: helicase-related protein [Bacteroidota bacterium]